jgi:hypothetical protein
MVKIPAMMLLAHAQAFTVTPYGLAPHFFRLSELRAHSSSSLITSTFARESTPPKLRSEMSNHGRRNKVPAPAIKPAEVAQPIGDGNAMSPPAATLVSWSLLFSRTLLGIDGEQRANRVSGITSWLANTPDGPYSSAPVV